MLAELEMIAQDDFGEQSSEKPEPIQQKDINYGPMDKYNFQTDQMVKHYPMVFNLDKLDKAPPPHGTILLSPASLHEE